MNGADHLLSSLTANGVSVCFANPGTSEMHLVAALGRNPSMRGVLALEEGVATGAADGFARLTDRPASTLLHLGPGLANGLSNLHNAIRARSGVVNVVGDHATYHRDLDAPLTSDIEGTARPFSTWVRTSTSSELISSDTADAVGAGLGNGVATLILPADVAWNSAPSTHADAHAALPTRPYTDSSVIDSAARELRRNGRRCALLMGGKSLREEQVALAVQISAATGAHVLSDTFVSKTERGAGRFPTRKVPYPVRESTKLFANFDAVILIDTKAPVSFFAYPNQSSVITQPGTKFFHVSPVNADSRSALEELRDLSVNETRVGPRPVAMTLPPKPTGPARPEKITTWLCSAIPENAIVIDEIGTSGPRLFHDTETARPHDLISATGGSIGYALPTAVGAAIACPDRDVIALESDGSGMYKLQALWTQSREGLKIINLIFANRRYQTLRNEMVNVGAGPLGQGMATSLLDIDNPTLDWVALARGMGVSGRRVETMEDLDSAFRASVATDGPSLIEVVL